MGVGRAGVWMSHGEGREAPHPGKEASRAHEGITLERDSQETAQLSVAWNNQSDVSLTDSLSRSSTRHPPGARTGGTEGASGKGRPRRSKGGSRGQDQPRQGQASEKVEKHETLPAGVPWHEGGGPAWKARRSHVSGCDRRKGRRDDDTAGKCVALAVVRESPADAFREAGGRAPARREGPGREGTKAGLPKGGPATG